LYLSKQSKLKSTVLSELHATPTTGHSGFTKPYDRVKHFFFWDGMKQDIRKFVAKCEVCQRNKGETIKSPGEIVKLHLSLAYHPHTDGQTEVVNKCLETYLRCFASEKQHKWAQWLPLAEWWYNTTYHTTTRMTPFEAVYGQKPPSVLSYLSGTSKVQAVDQTLTVREDILRTLKENLVMAQNQMKQQADQGRSKRQFTEEDQVFLRL
jgi:hypothetical protein